MLEIDSNKINLIGRKKANFCFRASNNTVFELQKPSYKLGIGFDHLPEHVRNNSILSGNDLAKLTNIESLLPKE